MPTTIYDIARELRLSGSTVSRVLNGRHSALVSQATRERILKAAAEVGYRPNAVARALATGKTHSIGLFVPSLRERTDPQFAQMLEAVETKAHALGYRLVLSGDLGSIAGEGQVDGIVVLGAPEPAEARLPRDTPAVFVHPGPAGAANSVCWSDEEGAFAATRYLLGLGHRRIAGLFAEYPDADPPHAKVAGFRRAVREAVATGQEWRGVRSPDQFENAYLLARDGLQGSRRVTAVFARNDVLALGATKAAREAGLAVPGGVSVVGYSDTLLARCADPGLTSVRTPIAQAGEIAVEQLVRAMDAGGAGFTEVVLPTTLTVRQSCAPPATDS